MREWDFRTRLRVAGNPGDHCIEAISNVCDGPRSDALVAAREGGVDALCEESVTGEKWARSRHTNSKNCLVSAAVVQDRCHDNDEKTWSPLLQIDPVIFLSEGHRADMLLD